MSGFEQLSYAKPTYYIWQNLSFSSSNQLDLNDNEGYLMFGSQEIYEKMQEKENREEK